MHMLQAGVDMTVAALRDQPPRSIAAHTLAVTPLVFVAPRGPGDVPAEAEEIAALNAEYAAAGTPLRILRGVEESVDPDRNLMVRLVRRVYPVTGEFHGSRWFVKLDGRRFATPLLLCLAAGCAAIGLGSLLVTGQILQANNWAALEQNARRFRALVQKARPG